MRTKHIANYIGIVLATIILCGCTTLDKQAAGLDVVVQRTMNVWFGYYFDARDNDLVPADTLAKQRETVRQAYAVYQACMNTYDLARKLDDKPQSEEALKNMSEAVRILSNTVNAFIVSKPTKTP